MERANLGLHSYRQGISKRITVTITKRLDIIPAAYKKVNNKHLKN
jgi:hypothetical protein